MTAELQNKNGKGTRVSAVYFVSSNRAIVKMSCLHRLVIHDYHVYKNQKYYTVISFIFHCKNFLHENFAKDPDTLIEQSLL